MPACVRVCVCVGLSVHCGVYAIPRLPSGFFFFLSLVVAATIAYIINCLSLGFRILVFLSIAAPQREREGRKER